LKKCAAAAIPPMTAAARRAFIILPPRGAFPGKPTESFICNLPFQ
jgi:hypothetical protein